MAWDVSKTTKVIPMDSDSPTTDTLEEHPGAVKECDCGAPIFDEADEVCQGCRGAVAATRGEADE